MWLLIILALIVIISSILTYIAENNAIDFLEFFAPAVLIISVALLLIFSSVAVVINLSAPADYASMQEDYKTLTYQLENHFYDNLLDISKKELIDEVKEYNQTLIRGRILKENSWIGVFYPLDYDSLELINLEGY